MKSLEIKETGPGSVEEFYKAALKLVKLWESNFRMPGLWKKVSIDGSDF